MVKKADIPKGYKQTEVGIIPEDWEAKQLAMEIDLLTGYPFSSNQYCTDGIRLLRCSNIKRGVTDWAEDITQFWDKVTPDLRSYCLKEGDIVIAMDGSLVGKSFARLSKNDLPALLLQRVARIRSNKIDMGYLKEFVCSDFFTKYCDSVKTVTAIPHISPSDINKYTIPVPSTKAEQQAIAEALSDVDGLIGSLDDLIAKKRQIKQGTMQQLLTGKKRLPGFSGEWEEKKLGEFLDYEQPTNYLVRDTEYNDNNQIPVLTAGKSFILGYTHEDFGIFTKLPVIIFDDFTTASKYVDFPFKAKSSAMKMLVPRTEGVNLRFIYEIMQQIKFPLGDHKRHWIGEYQYVDIIVPSPKEQSSIAKVLGDMDAEVKALEQKLDKYKQIKQGMMQELLTGKTRLV